MVALYPIIYFQYLKHIEQSMCTGKPAIARHILHGSIEHQQTLQNVHSGHLADAFIQAHTFTHRRWSQPCKPTASSSGAVEVRCLAQGQLDSS